MDTKYQEFKFLSDSLTDLRLLSEFETTEYLPNSSEEKFRRKWVYTTTVSTKRKLSRNPPYRLTLEKEIPIKTPAISHSGARSSATVGDGIQKQESTKSPSGEYSGVSIKS